MKTPPSKSLIEFPSDREMRLTRLLDAPRDLVWSVWTTPQHVARWWGPKGFTNVIHEMDVRPGGIWRLAMHAPDGTVYPNHIEFIEVVKPERLVYHHGDDANPRQFHVTTEFFAESGKTKFVTLIRFRSREDCDRVKGYAVDGHNSSMVRLNAVLDELLDAGHDVVNRRVVTAPREAVWRALAEPVLLAQWWGPKGFTNTFHAFDFREGGLWRFTMHGPDGANYANEKRFLEIAPLTRIVFRHEQPGHDFTMVMALEDAPTGTELTWLMRFDDAADCERVKPFVLTANEENFDRLVAVLG